MTSPASPNIAKTSQKRILVVGDVLLDSYWFGTSSRISPEAPVPVVRVQAKESRLGGAANVALNIHSLGANVMLLGLVGDDPASRAIQANLKQYAVPNMLLLDPEIQTIEKVRVLAQNQQLLRADFEEDQPYSKASHRLAEAFQSLLPSFDILVFSDYAKGTLAEVKELIALAKAVGKTILVDPKGTDFSKYHGASLLTPNFAEFTAIVGDCLTEQVLEEKAQSLITSLSLDALLVTRGAKGMTLVRENQVSQHQPSLAKEVFDVTGAGDTVVAALAVGLAQNNSLQDCVAMANKAAGLVVAKLGTAFVTKQELQTIEEPRPSKHPSSQSKLVTLEELKAIRQKAKENKQVMVMTNGCFDIVHAGHVSYLEQARALGDILVVAVNSDESVAKLKGPSRPVNMLEDRMKILASLAFVDYVISFKDETPHSLYKTLVPNVLVKGGDYSVDTIIGAREVQANGGAVITLPYVKGKSTTTILEDAKVANLNIASLN